MPNLFLILLVSSSGLAVSSIDSLDLN